MELSDSVIVLGQLVDYGPGVFGSTTGLVERFGPERVRDFPVSESAMTATGIGAAVAGCRPVLVHHRLDFMLYSMDAIVNWMALWRFKSNTQSSLPIVIRAIVGRGWGQGPQHSKSLHAWFAHVPGIKVAMPATAFDAKGLLLEAIFGENPVIIVEHRSLFTLKDRVPTMPYRVRFGRAAVRGPASRDRQRRSQPEAQSAGQRAVRRAFAGQPRVRFRRSRGRLPCCPARASMRKGRARLQLPPRRWVRGRRDVREVHRPGAEGCRPGARRGQDAQPQLHRHRAHPPGSHPRG